MPDWNWDESQSESGVVHQSTPNTDHNDAGTLKQGYDYANFSVISPDPVACWPLHENSGTTAYDLAGTNDGTYSGPTLGQTGLLGTTAASFDGTDDEITTPATNGTQSFTVSCWVKPTGLGGNDTMHREWGSINNFIFRLEGGTINLYIYQGTGGNVKNVSGSTLSTGTWYYVVGLYDGSTLELYLNGNLDASNTVDINRTISGDAYSLGSDTHNNRHYFEGTMADARLYDSALTATEIQTMYDVVATQGTWTGTAKPL